jgi:hypothetical protein
MQILELFVQVTSYDHGLLIHSAFASRFQSNSSNQSTPTLCFHTGGGRASASVITGSQYWMTNHA